MDQRLQGLAYARQLRDRSPDLIVPSFMAPGQIVGFNNVSTAFLWTGLKGFDDVEAAVVIGQLLPLRDVPDRDLQPVWRKQAVGIGAVIHEAGVIPAKDIVPGTVAITVLIQHLAEEIRKVNQVFWRKGPV
jgi:hypothetical protein